MVSFRVFGMKDPGTIFTLFLRVIVELKGFLVGVCSIQLVAWSYFAGSWELFRSC